MNHHISGQLRLISFLACTALYFLLINGTGTGVTDTPPTTASSAITLAMK